MMKLDEQIALQRRALAKTENDQESFFLSLFFLFSISKSFHDTCSWDAWQEFPLTKDKKFLLYFVEN